MQKSSLILLALTILAAVGLFSMSPASSIDNAQELYQYKIEFNKFKFEFNRNYEVQEQAYRFKIFKDNLIKINKHNADKTQTYEMGVNQFSDMTQEQFIEKILMNNLKNIETIPAPTGVNYGPIKDSADWTDSKYSTPVKNQGQCGSCWAFSTTATLQSNVAAAKGGMSPVISLSEQQLVDCCGAKGFQCQGCNGAWPEWAFNYINNTGSVTQSDYPYKAVGQTCKEVSALKPVKYLNSANPWTQFASGDIKSIQKALSKTGPVSICVDASNWSAYKSGVFANCGVSTLNHAVTAVGYAEDGTWLVRNSWGASWGQKGFIKLASGGTCGLDKHAIIPNLA